MVNSERLPTGYQLQNYRIEEILGEGGFGLTYKATDLNLNRVVAIKEYMPLGVATRSNTGDVVPTNSENEETYQQGLQRFVEEAQALALFEHDNLVKVKSFLRQHNTAYIIMEYVDGMTFSEWLRLNPKPTEDALIGIMSPILNGLHELHQTGLLHRDIKPSNIYICANDRPILLDFGAVRNSMRSDQNKDLSVVQYTEGYAPPEQYGKSGQGPWTDVYAVGACLYLGVTGEVVTNAMERFTEVQSGNADPQPSIDDAVLRDDYSQHFLDAIEQAISLDRKERISDALNLKNRLQNIDPQPIFGDDDATLGGHGTEQSNLAATAEVSGDKATVIRDPEDDATVVRMSEDAATTARDQEDIVKVARNVAVEASQTKQSSVSSKTSLLGTGKSKAIVGASVLTAMLALFWFFKSPSLNDQSTEKEVDDAKPTVAETQSSDANTAVTQTTEKQNTELLATVNSLYSQVEELGVEDITKADVTKSNNDELQLIANDLKAAIKANARSYEIGSSAKDIDEAVELCNEYTSDCEREWYEDELSITVSLTPFELDKFEITVGEFSQYAAAQTVVTAAETNGFSYRVDPDKDYAVLRSNGTYWNNAYGMENDVSDLPVVHLNRAEAEEYCNSVGKRLPSEAEWEYAARGTDRFKYPWGNTWDPDRVNWGGNNTASMVPVNSFQDNGRGYFDLAGSVTEWTSTDSNEEGVAILKGGSRFDSNVANFRAPVKRLESIDYTGEDVGFRCSRNTDEWPVN